MLAIVFFIFAGCENEEDQSRVFIYGFINFAGSSIPVSDVTVKLGKEQTVSIEKGYYHFVDVLPGNYELRADKDLFDTYIININVSDTSGRYDIPMTSEIHTRKVAGSVRGLYSGPKQGSEVIILNPDNTESDLKTMTDNSGYYEINNVPEGQRPIVVKVFGEMIYKADINLDNPSDSVFNYDIVLPEPFEFTDSRDGRTYSGLKIGTQTWMIDNLAYLPEVNQSGDKSTRDPRYYVYGFEGNNVSFAKTEENYQTFGVLYNWPAAMDGEQMSNTIPSGIRGICPEGWHLPSNDEWEILFQYGYNLRGYMGRPSISQVLSSDSYWEYSSKKGDTGRNLSVNNQSGFSALPAGSVSFGEGFFGLGQRTSFWTTSSGGLRGTAMGISLYYNSNYIGRNEMDYWAGSSIRCIKN